MRASQIAIVKVTASSHYNLYLEFYTKTIIIAIQNVDITYLKL
jgi:hypothetical protein